MKWKFLRLFHTLMHRIENLDLFQLFEGREYHRVRIAVSFLLILVGLGLFVWQLDDVAAVEQSCRDPIVVEAVIEVEVLDGTYNDEYISYVCDGVSFDRVYLGSRKSWMSLDRDGETILVALDPRDHGILAKDMVNGEMFFGSLVLASLGFAVLLYSALLNSEKLRYLLVRRGRRECRDLDQPDYPVDLIILTVLIYLVMSIVLWCVFPLAVGIGSTLGAGMILITGAAIQGISRSLERNRK